MLDSGNLIESPLAHPQSDWVQDAAMERWTLIAIQRSAKADGTGETWKPGRQRRPLLLYVGDGNPDHR